MKILIYNRHFFPSIGGTEESGRIMARELSALGHRVTVVTATALTGDVPELDEGYAVVRGEHVATLVRLARENDVLFSRGGISLRAFLAAHLGGVAFLAFQEFDAVAGRAGSSFRRYATDAAKALVRRHTRLHVVVSDALRSGLALPSEADCFKLYNPVKKELWTPAPAGCTDRDLDVLFVGRLVVDKGPLVLRDALLALPVRDRLRVAIVGNCSDRAAWQDRFREVAGEVAFLGSVAGEGLRDLYARARIVAMPSLVNEGMGMVAAEALANGTPVCASDQPALREVIGDAGLFHPMGNAGGLAVDIDRLLGNPDAWKVLSDRAQAERARFSMTKYRERLTTLITKVASLDQASEVC